MKALFTISLHLLIALSLSSFSEAAPGPKLAATINSPDWASVSRKLSLQPKQLAKLRLLQAQSGLQLCTIRSNTSYDEVCQRKLTAKTRHDFKKALYSILSPKQQHILALEGDYGIFLGDSNPLVDFEGITLSNAQAERIKVVYWKSRSRIEALEVNTATKDETRVSLIGRVNAESRRLAERVLTPGQRSTLARLNAGSGHSLIIAGAD